MTHPLKAGRERGASRGVILAVIAVAGLLVIFGVPRALRWYLEANDRAAIASLRGIGEAQERYAANYRKGYAPSLAALGPPPAGTAVSDAHVGLIDAVLAGGSKTGYQFTYQAVDADGDGRAEGYSVNADPITIGASGQQYFFLDQTKVIRGDRTAPANAGSKPI